MGAIRMTSASRQTAAVHGGGGLLSFSARRQFDRAGVGLGRGLSPAESLEVT